LNSLTILSKQIPIQQEQRQQQLVAQ
jgi:hypothetical protein